MSDPVRSLETSQEAAEVAIPSTKPTVDIAALMADIRKRITSDMEQHRDARAAISPLAGKFVDARGIKYGDLQHAENLRYLNTHYPFETKLSGAEVVTHRRGPLGKLVVLFKRKFSGFLRNSIFAQYLSAERGFVEHLVRHLNDTGRYIDARDERVSKELETMMQRVDDEKTATIFALQRQMVDLSTGFEQRLSHIDSMVRGLEGFINNGHNLSNPNPPRAAVADADEKTQATVPNRSYLLLENRYRGSEAEIERRTRIYPDLFKDARGPVLDIGSGRGELLRLFKAAGIEGYGVDLDTVMVNVANSNGCKTLYGDGIAHLRSLADASLGGVVAIQVVEHLTREQLKELCELVKRKVRPGGRIAFETINPQSLLALSSNYFRDPTHVWPMHPDTLGYMATLAGLKIIETRMLSPVSPNHLLKEIPVDSSHTPAVGDAINRINENIAQLNRLLYGFQDYCIVLEA
jgi:2-polyprenyl-3-methyl-5-hydroxy-6-metoxy-1,4-benzoquinol methylase